MKAHEHEHDLKLIELVFFPFVNIIHWTRGTVSNSVHTYFVLPN